MFIGCRVSGFRVSGLGLQGKGDPFTVKPGQVFHERGLAETTAQTDVQARQAAEGFEF